MLVATAARERRRVVSPVAAPADRRFRRAHVKPARRRATWRASGRGRRSRTACVAALAVLLRLSRRRRRRARAACCRSTASSCAATSGCRAAKCWRCSNGLRGENLVWTDLDAWRERLLASPWVRDAALRRSLPSTVEVVVVRAAADRHRPHRTADCIWSTSAASIIDEYGPQYADLDLPIVDGLSPRQRRRTLTDERAGRPGGARDHVAAGASPTIARRLSQVDVTDLHNAAVILTGDPAVIYARRGSVPAAAASRTWSSRRRCASGSPTSTTSTCGSTIASTCGRSAHGRKRRDRAASSSQATGRAKRSGHDVTDPEAEWRVKSGIWSASTSARRR